MIEREEALTTLHRLAATADKGRGKVALVRGEAGIGKTTLLQQFQHGSQSSYKFYWGYCDDLHTPRVLGPIHDMSTELGNDVVKAMQTDPVSTKTLPAVVSSINRCEQLPIMIFEDVHWADNGTIDFLKCLGKRITALRLLIIISYRNDETAPRYSIANAFGELPHENTVRIKLSPITAKGTQQLANDAGREIDNLHAVTGGNPFFISELLSDNCWNNDELPVSILDAIGARLNRLNLQEQNFLETISIIPHAIERRLIELLFPENGLELLVSCSEKKLLQLDNKDRVRFRHELARLGTQSRTSILWRKNTHKKIAQALIECNTDRNIEKIAYHAHAADIGTLVLKYAPGAAEIASKSGAHSEAASHLRTALKYAAKSKLEVQAKLYESWSYEAALVKIDEEVIDARHRAVSMWKKIGRLYKVGGNLRWLSRLHWYEGHATKASRYADEAITVLESTDASTQKAMAFSLKSQFHMLNGRWDEAITWGNRALDTNRDDNTEVRVHALNNVGSAMVWNDNLAGLDLLRESLQLALADDLHEHAARVYTNMSDYAVNSGDFALAEKTINDGIVFDSNHDLDSWTHYLIGLQAALRLNQGRLIEAESIAEGVLKLDKPTLLMKLPALLVLARAQTRLGRPAAVDTLQKALDNAVSTGEAQYIVPARLALVEAAWLKNHHEEARNQLHQLLSADIPLSGNWGDAEVALWLYRYNIKNKKIPTDRLPVPYQLEIYGKPHAASNAWLSIGSPYPAAVALIATSNTTRGAESVLKATQLFDNMNAAGTLKKVSFVAKEWGLNTCILTKKRGPGKATQQHPLGLTKKEQQIIPWVIKGLSNKEISDRFFRSERTIENHIASIYRKLNVHSRMEALLRIQNEPWIASLSEADVPPHNLHKKQTYCNSVVHGLSL